MVKISDIFKRDIRINNSEFNIDNVYKKTKIRIESLGYIFLEKKQSLKPKKYGEEIIFDFDAFKIVDNFCRTQINIEANFNNLTRTKKGYYGDVIVTIKAKQELDYKNTWATKKFNLLLFKIYLQMKRSELKRKYTIPLWMDAENLYNYLKELFELS